MDDNSFWMFPYLIKKSHDADLRPGSCGIASLRQALIISAKAEASGRPGKRCLAHAATCVLSTDKINHSQTRAYTMKPCIGVHIVVLEGRKL